MRVKNCLAYAALICACSAAPAWASVIEYTSQAAFDAAITGATTYNFEGIAPVGGFSGVEPTVGGVTFTAPASSYFVFGHNYYPTTYGGVAFFAGEADPAVGTSNATATLSGVTAIGFFYGPGDDAKGVITATLSTGDVYNSLAIPAFATTDFVGFISDTPITSVAFTEQGYGMDIIQFELGSANPAGSPVPEPSTFLLFGAGLIGVGLLRKRFSK